MRLITIDLRCLHEYCLHDWYETVDRKRAGWDETFRCPACGGETARRVPSSPALTGKASYLDGQERPGWKDIREADRLENAMMDFKPEDKARAKKELARIRKGSHG